MGRFDDNATDQNSVVEKYVPKRYPTLEKTHEEKIILDRYKYWVDQDIVPEPILSKIKSDMQHVGRTIDYKNK